MTSKSTVNMSVHGRATVPVQARRLHGVVDQSFLVAATVTVKESGKSAETTLYVDEIGRVTIPQPVREHLDIDGSTAVLSVEFHNVVVD